MECPHCHSHDYIYSEYWRRFDWILGILGFSTFACRNCYQIFYKFRLLHNLHNWLHQEVLRIRYVNAWKPSPEQFSGCEAEFAPDPNRHLSFDSAIIEPAELEPAEEPIALEMSPSCVPTQLLALNESQVETLERREST
jgi:hypothetical protein